MVLRPGSLTCAPLSNLSSTRGPIGCAIACRCLCDFTHRYRMLRTTYARRRVVLHPPACPCLPKPAACAQTTQSASEVACTYSPQPPVVTANTVRITIIHADSHSFDVPGSHRSANADVFHSLQPTLAARAVVVEAGVVGEGEERKATTVPPETNRGWSTA